MSNLTLTIDKDYILSIRHELHMYPELAFDLPKTTALIRRELEAMGIPYTEQYGKSSIVAFLNPTCTVRSVALRADTDALPLTEKTDLPYASKTPGKMHACGHDAHTAMLLGAAKALKPVENALSCRVVLIFQACEEGDQSGARLMVEDGVTELFDEIVGMHVENWLEAGSVGICPGVSMAASHPIYIEFFGRSAHATLPQSGVNALAMAVETYNGINALQATRMNPFSQYVCSVGMLRAGETDNVIPDYAEMMISLRTYDKETERFIVESIRRMAENAAMLRGGTIAFRDEEKALPLENDPTVSARVLAAAAKVVGQEQIVTMPRKLSSEDFSFYLSRRPGAFLRLGTRNAEKGCTTLPHNNDFLLDEDALPLGSRILAQYVLDLKEDDK
ncbi:MAG: amidohydrolase [Ruminococcaceae bacterium]|nr:amidohydrolase [Oscillospiraceae bacterium]